MSFRISCIICMSLFISLFVTGCLSKSKEFMPDQVIENALRDDTVVSYYAESETVYFVNDEIESTSTTKEWFRKDGWTRTEIIDNDGETMILTNDLDTLKIYDTMSNELIEARSSEFSEMTYSPKEEMLSRIETIQETHDITYVGQEKVIGRKTHHIHAVPRDKTSLLGEQEFWFDAEYWFVLKNSMMFGDDRSEMKYIHFEVNNAMEDELFNIKETEDMVVIDLDDFLEEAKITLEEMTDRMDRPFLYFEETDDLAIESINLFEIEEDEFAQYTFEYTKDGLPYLSLTIMESEPLPSFFEEIEELEIGGVTVIYSAEYNQDIFEWNVGNVQYEAWVNDPSVTKDEVIQMIEHLFDQKDLLKEEREGEAS